MQKQKPSPLYSFIGYIISVIFFHYFSTYLALQRYKSHDEGEKDSEVCGGEEVRRNRAYLLLFSPAMPL